MRKEHNWLLLFIVKPIRTHGVPLRGCALKFNIARVQRVQSKILRLTTGTPWFVNNNIIQDKLHVPFVMDIINSMSLYHFQKIKAHPIDIVEPLLKMTDSRGLERKQIMNLFWVSELPIGTELITFFIRQHLFNYFINLSFIFNI